MTVWDLLTGLCFGMPIGGALAPAGLAKAGIGGYAFAITIGVVLGVCCAWMMRVAGNAVVAKLQRRPDWLAAAPLRRLFFGGFIFAVVLWIVFVLLLGVWVSSALLRLVS